MSLLGDISDPVKDAAALDPILQRFAEKLVAQFTAQSIPAIKQALMEVLDGLTVTNVVSKKETVTK